VLGNQRDVARVGNFCTAVVFGCAVFVYVLNDNIGIFGVVSYIANFAFFFAELAQFKAFVFFLFTLRNGFVRIKRFG